MAQSHIQGKRQYFSRVQVEASSLQWYHSERLVNNKQKEIRNLSGPMTKASVECAVRVEVVVRETAITGE
jgi:hypothetical protein